VRVGVNIFYVWSRSLYNYVNNDLSRKNSHEKILAPRFMTKKVKVWLDSEKFPVEINDNK